MILGKLNHYIFPQLVLIIFKKGHTREYFSGKKTCMANAADTVTLTFRDFLLTHSHLKQETHRKWSYLTK